jgi:hypothetical protein
MADSTEAEAGGAVQLDVAARRARDVAADAEPEPGAAPRLLGREEGLEAAGEDGALHSGGEEAEGRHLLLVEQAGLQLALLGHHLLDQQGSLLPVGQAQRVALDGEHLAGAGVGVALRRRGGACRDPALGARFAPARDQLVARAPHRGATLDRFRGAIRPHDAPVVVEHEQRGRGRVHHHLEERPGLLGLAGPPLDLGLELGRPAALVAVGHEADHEGGEEARRHPADVVQRVGGRVVGGEGLLKALDHEKGDEHAEERRPRHAGEVRADS